MSFCREPDGAAPEAVLEEVGRRQHVVVQDAWCTLNCAR